MFWFERDQSPDLKPDREVIVSPDPPGVVARPDDL